jgi:hypothetical protein
MEKTELKMDTQPDCEMDIDGKHVLPVSCPPALVEWGVAAQAFEGCAESGDHYLVEPFPNGVLIAVADGLGHGPKAATAGKAAIAALKGHAHQPVVQQFQHCHEKLRRTRGVVMSAASFDGLEETMTWLGVGNVKGVLLRANGKARSTRERLLPRGGVVGYQMPSLRPSSVPIAPGDTLIFATDGLRSIFTEDLNCGDPPQQMANHILAQHGRGTDDAMVLVARYVGSIPPGKRNSHLHWKTKDECKQLT